MLNEVPKTCEKLLRLFKSFEFGNGSRMSNEKLVKMYCKKKYCKKKQAVKKENILTVFIPPR